MTRFLVYDVFTGSAFSGNQLAVIPEAESLAENQLQPIAREFNFSETVFLYPATDPGHDARVRIFTPTMEIPFAGHPTIGTAIALREAIRADGGDCSGLILELGVGPIPCVFDGDEASFTTRVPLDVMAEPEVDLVARALGLPSDKILTTTHPPTMAGVGIPFVLTELSDRAALATATPATDALREGAARYPSGLDFPQFAYVRNGSTVDARMFAPLDNIPEDPATGAACAALAALLRERLREDVTLSITQGEDMGRRSLIGAKATADGVTISGTAVRTMEGRLVV